MAAELVAARSGLDRRRAPCADLHTRSRELAPRLPRLRGADHPARGRPLRGGQGGRHARRALLAVLPAALVKVRRGETEYGIGADPARRLREDHRDEPARGDRRRRSRHRAYYRQPVWKRIVVIAAGPVVNILIAFLILGRCSCSRATPPATQPRRPGRRGSAGGGGPEAGRPDRLRRRRAATPTGSARRSPRHRCARQRTVDGCAAADAGDASSSSATAQAQTCTVTPAYDADAKRTRLGLRLRRRARTSRRARRGRRASPSTGMWRSRPRPSTAIGRLFYDSEARKQVSGVVGSYEVDAPGVEFDAAQALRSSRSSRCRWRSSTCSRSCRSTAATSSGRWPRRSAAGRSRSRHGAGQRRRVRAGRSFLFVDRAVERHRPAARRGLRRR